MFNRKVEPLSENMVEQIKSTIRQQTFTEKKDDPCWKDHEMIGTKKKNGKDVPNCVPKEEVEYAKPKKGKDDDGEGLDPVGKEDDDVDNDGDSDSSDRYLKMRRKAIGKALKKEETDLSEDMTPEIQSLQNEIESELTTIFRNYFPNGWIRRVGLSNVVRGSNDGGTMRMRAGLIGNGNMQPDVSRISNGIIENDLMKMYFAIRFEGGNVVIESHDKATLLTINPTKQFMTLGYNKIPFRKTTVRGGDKKKILAAFDKHFKRVKAAIKSESDNNNFYRQDQYEDKYFAEEIVLEGNYR